MTAASDAAVRTWALVGLLVLVALLCSPNLYIDHHDLFWIDGWGPDASLFVALHAGERDGLRFGSDLVFTYGPLGYLQFALYLDDASWMRSVAYQLFAHGLFFVALFAFARRHCTRLVEVLWLCFVATVFLQAIGGWLVDLKIVVAFLILSYLLLTDSRGSPWREAALGALASPLFYVKFSGGITAVLIALAYATLSCWQRRPARGVALCLGLFVTAALLGLLLQGSPGNLLAFFDGAVEIASSYVDAVSLPGPAWQVALAIASWLSYAALLLVDLRRGRIGRSLLLLSAGLLFAGFKHGFVRQDAHVAGFFSIWMIVFALYVLSSLPPRRAAATFSVSLALVSFSMTFLNGNDFFFHRILTSISAGPGNLVRFYDFVAHQRPELLRMGHAERRAWLRDALSRVPDSDLEPATLEKLEGRSVDVFPWEVALLERYGLRWSPRPVFQSYSAFSEELDERNEAHFLRADAPELVLYGFDSVDGRYPPFDEPHTFRALLTRYEVDSRDNAYLLLRRRAAPTADGERPLSSVRVALGETVDVPLSTTGWVFAYIRPEYSLWGRLARILYRPPPLYVRLLSRGMALKYRLVPSTSTGGVFLSRYVLGPRDLLDVFEGELARNVDAIAVTTSSPSFFAPELEVEFFEVPYPVRLRDDWKVACGPGDEVLKQASFSIDVAQGKHLHELRQPIAVDRGVALELSGWAVDEVAGELLGDILLEIDGRLVAPSDYERWRPDVAELLKNDAYAYAGWRAHLDLERLEPGIHKLTLRLVSKDGTRCYAPRRGITIDVQD